MDLRTYLQNRGSIKTVKWIIIPLLLIIFGLGGTLYYINSTSGFTITLHNHTRGNILSSGGKELVAGNKIKGEFQAKDDNLGIVAVRFNTFFRTNEDIVRFSIKEKSQRGWYYQNTYTTPQFQPNQYFTFGFPVISNSEGKKYYFEIESLQGKAGNAVALSTIEPIFVSKYQYSKDLIRSNTRYATQFLFKKTINLVSDPEFLLAAFAYSLPLILYIISVYFFDLYLSESYFLVFLPLVLMVALAMKGVSRNDPITLGISLVWFFVLYAYNIRGTLSFAFSFLFIVSSALLYYCGLSELSLNISMWGYLLFGIGTIKSLQELVNKERELTGVLDFFHKLIIREELNTKSK